MQSSTEEITVKMERVVTAMYMATSHISDSDGLRSRTRMLALTIMSDMIELIAGQDTSSKDKLIKELSINLNQVMSLIKILMSDRAMSDRNGDLLIGAYNNIMSFINIYKTRDVSDIKDNINDISYRTFSDGMLTVNNSRGLAVSSVSIARQSRSALSLGSALRSTGDMNRQNSPDHSSQSAIHNNKRVVTAVDKEGRHTRILGLLSEAGSAGYNMSELLSIIDNISEKTMQRELSTLIDLKKVERIGEKRWSRYILAS